MSAPTLAEVLELAELQARGSVLPGRPDRIKLARFAIARIAEMGCSDRAVCDCGEAIYHNSQCAKLDRCGTCPPCLARARKET